MASVQGRGEAVPPNRRRFSDRQKAQILAEAMRPDRTVVAVARKYGVSTVSIYTWRREMEERAPEAPETPAASAPEAPARAPATSARAASAEETDVSRPARGAPKAVGEPVSSRALVRDEDEREVFERLAVLEDSLRRLQDQWRAGQTVRRSLVNVLKTIGAQLQLVAQLCEMEDEDYDSRLAGAQAGKRLLRSGEANRD